jgi:hypothetical protein
LFNSVSHTETIVPVRNFIYRPTILPCVYQETNLKRWVQPSLAGIQCSEPEPQRRPLPAHPGRLLLSGEPQQPRQPEIKLPAPINLAKNSLSQEGYLFEGLKKHQSHTFPTKDLPFF